jgi:manganese transport protein
VLTAADVLVILYFQQKGFRVIESIVAGLILLIFACFGYQILVSHPNWELVGAGLLPKPEIVTSPGVLYIAIGILGATVMPHNLYLHSSIVQTRNYDKTPAGKKEAIAYATLDSTLSLLLAFFVNAAILVVAAATFHHTPHEQVADISDAYHLLDPLLGVKWAGILFAVALLAAGQNSTLTGTLAGQIVMEGFLNIRLKPWLRRLITRLIAIVPALIVTILYGEKGTGKLLVLSQVILSLQLSFAVIPLVLFTGSRLKMGPFANSPVLKVTSWLVASIIVVLNIYLLLSTFFS